MATMEIAVVGAGIAGLAVAGGLLKRGHDVTIFEADSKIRAGGSGITLGPNALTALDYLGCGDDFRALQQAQPKLYGGQRCQNGRWLSKIAPEITTQSLALDRAELHSILKRHAEGAGLRVGVEVVGVDKQKGALTTKDGQTSTFDLIVGADGIRSAVRAAWPKPGEKRICAASSISPAAWIIRTATGSSPGANRARSASARIIANDWR